MTAQKNIERQNSRFQLFSEGFTPRRNYRNAEGQTEVLWTSGEDFSPFANETPSGFQYQFNGIVGEGSTFAAAKAAFKQAYEEFRLTLG